MTLSNRIRAAALGTTPRNDRAWLAHSWLGWAACTSMVAELRCLGCHGEDEAFMQPFCYLTNAERRMFLLFVACALENP